MSPMASQIPSLTIVYSNVYSGADHRKHQSSASLAFVWGIRRWPANFPHKGPVTRKMFPFDDVVMKTAKAYMNSLRADCMTTHIPNVPAPNKRQAVLSPLFQHRLNLETPWICNYINYKVFSSPPTLCAVFTPLDDLHQSWKPSFGMMTNFCHWRHRWLK